MKNNLLQLLLLLLSAVPAFSQTWPADTINSRINTGDPAFPFPQFLEYTAGKSLAANNAEGVTHADMEKTMKEGYKMMMHRCLYTGKILNGKKYIVYNHPTVPYNYNTFVSEGDGYALLAAAYFADKEAFDGLWLQIHDSRLSKVKKYYDCADLRPTYPMGVNMPCWRCDETSEAGSTDVNSAADGDFDIAMGLLIASAQWPGGMGIADACGRPISYKEEALKAIKAIADTVFYTQTHIGAVAAVKGYLTGDIGIDGYIKNGNTWGEVTDWRSSAANTLYGWAKAIPDPLQVKDFYTDNIAPAYFNQFAKYLTANGGTNWQISQFKRAEASSDWLIGQMYAKGYIASSGSATVNDNGTVTTFGQHPAGAGGEDFRASWRTILNYVWHGNPVTRWDSAAHTVVTGKNTFEKDMAIRHADFLKNPRTLPSPASAAICERLGASPDPSAPLYKGVVNVKQAHLVTGASGFGSFRNNYNVGTGAAAAVASEDLDLTGEIFRQAEILWEDVNYAMPRTATDEERYLQSTPKYFHDWFRLLGMLTASGNLHPFGIMTPSANLKVYQSVDKTFAYGGDLVTYTVKYRNYGSVEASGITLKTELGNDYELVSAGSGGIFSSGGITWNIGTVPGFRSATGISPTQGSVQFTVRVKNISARSRNCLTSTITNTTNALSWTSNEYPNNASYTMERNCVDLLTTRPMKLTKTTDRSIINPGETVTFKLAFENTSAPDLWLNGGRDKVVLSYGNHNSGASFYQYYRLWHSAPEAYINLNNYRVSYYLNDSVTTGLYNAATNPTGWAISVDNQNELDKYLYNPALLALDQRISFDYQKLNKGTTAEGSWNQRMLLRFANVLTAPTSHLYDNQDNISLIHKGVIGPAVIRTKMESYPLSNLSARLADDWSYSNAVTIANLDGNNHRLTPVSNSWASVNNPDLAVNNYSKDVCNPDVPNFKKVSLEEFDGYTWRRIAGNSPLPGRESSVVQLIDTIPKELAWNGFTDQEALGLNAVYTPAPAGAGYTGIVTWYSPVLPVGAQGDIGYTSIVKEADPSCKGIDHSFVATGYLSSSTESPQGSSVNLRLSCPVTSIHSANSVSSSLQLLYYDNQIWVSTDAPVRYQIFDVMARKVATGDAINTIEIMNNLPSGVYLVYAVSATSMGNLKFFKP